VFDLGWAERWPFAVWSNYEGQEGSTSAHRFKLDERLTARLKRTSGPIARIYPVSRPPDKPTARCCRDRSGLRAVLGMGSPWGLAHALVRVVSNGYYRASDPLLREIAEIWPSAARAVTADQSKPPLASERSRRLQFVISGSLVRAGTQNRGSMDSAGLGTAAKHRRLKGGR